MVDNLVLVNNEEKYFDFIRELRNANHGNGFVDNVNITPEQQKKYMEKYKDCYYVCLHNSLPVGFVGSINNDIRVAVIPSYFGKGVGTFMIQELVKMYPDAYAKVKIENEASLRLFEKAGFKKKFYILER